MEHGFHFLSKVLSRYGLVIALIVFFVFKIWTFIFSVSKENLFHFFLVDFWSVKQNCSMALQNRFQGVHSNRHWIYTLMWVKKLSMIKSFFNQLILKGNFIILVGKWYLILLPHEKFWLTLGCWNNFLDTVSNILMLLQVNSLQTLVLIDHLLVVILIQTTHVV